VNTIESLSVINSVFDIDEYASKASAFAVYPEAGTSSGNELHYLALGLVEEAGEVAGKMAKRYRDETWDIQAVCKELGDVYWYLGQLCLALNVEPSVVLTMNLKKLEDRRNRMALMGDGDNR